MRDILKRILEHSADRSGTWRPPVGVLRDAWSGLVGDELAAVTRPSAIDWEERRLTIETATDAWHRELERHDAKLLARLNQVLPWQLEDLVIETGMIAAPDRSPDESPAPDARRPGSTQTTEQTGPVVDRVDAPEDVEQSLDSLDGGAADSARRILEHVREQD